MYGCATFWETGVPYKLIDALLPVGALAVFMGLLLLVGHLATGASAHEIIVAFGSSFDGHPYVSAFAAAMAILACAMLLMRVTEVINPDERVKAQVVDHKRLTEEVDSDD